MSNTQPEALRLADLFENYSGYAWEDACSEAAAELRRLQAETEALKAQRDKFVLGAEKILGMLMTQYHGAIAADCAEDQLRDLLASVKGGA